MDWEACLDTSQLILPVSLPGVSQFKGECVERGREIEYDLQGYLEMITFVDAWKWKASVVDKVTGLEASAGGYLNKKTALKEAMDLLFEKLEQQQELDYTGTATNEPAAATASITSTPTSSLQMSRPTVPRFSELMNEVGAKIPNKWRAVGNQLEVPPAILESFHVLRLGAPKECFREVFVYWRNNPILPFSWASVVKVLQSPEVEELELAKVIEASHDMS